MTGKVEDNSIVEMGDLFHIKHGYAFKGEFFANEGPYIVLTPGNFNEKGGFKLKSKEKYYTGDVPTDYILNKNDLIVAMTEQAEGLLGSSALIPESKYYLHNQRLGLITELDELRLNKRFLYYLFNTEGVRAQIRATANGAKVRHTSPSRIYEVKFSLFPIEAQDKIVFILSAYDDLIENNLKRIKILEEMAQMIYREWFVNFRFPNHKSIKMVDSPLGKIPEGWEVKTLKDVSHNFDRKRKPLSKMQREKMQGQYPYYGAAKIFDYINDYIFDGDYLLMGEDGSVITSNGYPMLQLASGKFWVNNHTHILQGKSPLSTEYLYLTLSNFSIQGYITGAAQPKITQANLNRIPVIMPEAGLLENFDTIVIDIFQSMKILKSKNTNLCKTRDLLLPKLISGELDVEVLELQLTGTVV